MSKRDCKKKETNILEVQINKQNYKIHKTI